MGGRIVPIRTLASTPFSSLGRIPPPGVLPDEAVAAVRDVLGTIGDTCPECRPDRF